MVWRASDTVRHAAARYRATLSGPRAGSAARLRMAGERPPAAVARSAGPSCGRRRRSTGNVRKGERWIWIRRPARRFRSIVKTSIRPSSFRVTASSTRYFGGVFLLFWLGGWVMGSRRPPSPSLCPGRRGAFIIFWLGGWTVGGILAALTAYRIFRPTVPETLQLKRGSIAYDSGIAPLRAQFCIPGTRASGTTGARLLSKRRPRRSRSAAAANSAPARDRDRQPPDHRPRCATCGARVRRPARSSANGSPACWRSVTD